MSQFPVGFSREYMAGENTVKLCDSADHRGLVPSLCSRFQGFLVWVLLVLLSGGEAGGKGGVNH